LDERHQRDWREDRAIADQSTWTLINTVLETRPAISTTASPGGNTYFYRVALDNSAGDSANLERRHRLCSGEHASCNQPEQSRLDQRDNRLRHHTKDKSIAANTLGFVRRRTQRAFGTHGKLEHRLQAQRRVQRLPVPMSHRHRGEWERQPEHSALSLIGDGQTLFDSGVVLKSGEDDHNISVAGVQQRLTLQVLPGRRGNIDYDHGDWAGATLYGVRHRSNGFRQVLSRRRSPRSRSS